MLAEHNDKKRFLLTIVDVLSRFAFVRPLQRKTPAEVVAAFASVVRQGGVTLGALHTDRGTEFYNTQMKAWLKKHDIRHYSTHSDKKAAMVERFKSMSTRGPGRRGTCHLTDFPQTRPGERVHPKTPQDEAVRSVDSSKRI